MHKLSKNTVKQLLEQEDSVTLSLYMPTHRFPTSEYISEDMLRFKNALKEVKEKLHEKKIDDEVIAILLERLESLYENTDFWQQTTEGVALFCSPAGLQYFNLPVECEMYTNVGDKYDITPLLALLSYDQPFYLLALATKHPTLFRGDMYGVEKVPIELPLSLEKALNIDEMYSNSQTVRAGGFKAGNPGMKSHGQGDSRQAGREERLKFFRLIDEKLHQAPEIDKNIPIILAGTDDEVSSYRDISRSTMLLPFHLNGNHVDTLTSELHAKAWSAIVESLDLGQQSDEIEKLNQLMGTGRASLEGGAISAAAKEGRVGTFLIGLLHKTRDTISDSNQEVVKIIFPEEYHVGRMADCARSVFEQGGIIIGVLRSALPRGATEAAVYRY